MRAMNRQTKSYHKFAQFYDLVMGDRGADVRFISSLIERYAPNAKLLVDIACGTGVITKGLRRKYKTYGIDASPAMLKRARRALPGEKFLCCDMRSFSLPKKVDVALCAFDSINHLGRFSDWIATFRNVRKNLSDDGVFIFDINTIGRLHNLANGRPWINFFTSKDFLMMNVAPKSPSRVEWDVKVFLSKRDNRYTVVREKIQETSFPVSDIREALLRYFSKVEVLDCEGKITRKERPSRLYFVAHA